jgi:hypothetical protein
MITKYIEFNIICDECGVDGCNTCAETWQSSKQTYNWDYLVPFSRSISEMKSTAKIYGWIFTKGKHICPKCQEIIMNRKIAILKRAAFIKKENK